MTPTAEKRPAEERIIEVNVGPRMRDSDSIGRVESVTADGITISDVTHTTGIVRFLASGGDAGRSYPVLIRWDVPSQPGQMLETVINLAVTAEG